VGKKLLVVDDNDLNRYLLREVLHYHGYEVIEASNGAEGVERARDHHPDLIFLDIQMPVMNGFTAIATLRREPDMAGVKIIAITSLAMNCDQSTIMEAGFDGYISKPFDIRELPEWVREWLGES
jgi:two-component system cell cycle response regulator DivK